jgi:CRP-like cAMP-binding protein
MLPLRNSPNYVLASLSAEDSERLRPHLTVVGLEIGTTLHRQMEIIPHIYFPSGGVISLVVSLSEGASVEAGMVGYNGGVGAGTALDGRLALSEAIVQMNGSASRVDAAVLSALADESKTLRAAIFRCEQQNMAHAQQVAACNAVHALEPRLARWLLQLRDLVRSDTLPVKQEFLAQMLGVQRTSVTLVARHLQAVGLITYRRGHIQLLDVEGLTEAACECYSTINDYYRQLSGWVPGM